MTSEEFGKMVKDYIDQKGLTDAQFAEFLGISRVTMHRIIKGRIWAKGPLLVKIIQGMGLDVEETLKKIFDD